MVAPNYKYRQSLGQRYGRRDPAQEDYWKELELMYSMKPGQEARALAEKEAEKNRAFTASESEKQRDAAGQAGMIQTGSNVLLTGAMLRGATKGAGEPFFGDWGTKTPKPGSPSTTDIQGPTGMDTGVGGMTTDSGQVMGSAEEGFAASGTGATETAAAGSSWGTGMNSVGGYGGIAAAILGALKTKERAADEGLPESSNTLAKYAGQSTQHPVAAIMNPTQWMTDTGLIDKNSTLGKFMGKGGYMEEKVMDPVSSFVSKVFGW